MSEGKQFIDRINRARDNESIMELSFRKKQAEDMRKGFEDGKREFQVKMKVE